MRAEREVGIAVEGWSVGMEVVVVVVVAETQWCMHTAPEVGCCCQRTTVMFDPTVDRR